MTEIIEILERHDYTLKNVTEVSLEQEGPKGVESVIQVAAAKDDALKVDLALDQDKNLIIVNNLACPEERLKESLVDLNRLSLHLDSNTLLVQSDAGEFVQWQNQGFAKNYQYLITGTPETFQEEKIDETLDLTAQQLAEHLQEDVQVYEVSSDLPYIYSAQIVDKKAEVPDDADYHCDLHFHALTGAVYLDRLWIAEEQRYKGLGSATVEILQNNMADIGANYLYLKATQSSESFWDRKGEFDSFFRLNLRWARRMRQQLRRAPGWDRVYCLGEELEHHLDYYGNHPGEDFDFFQAQEIIRLNSYMDE